MTPFDVLREVKQRTAEAVIAQSGLAHDGLRRHLRALFSGDDPTTGALLQEPILEGAHPFVAAGPTMATLAGSLLHSDLVAALDGLSHAHEYRFPRTRHPFRHQVEAWELLARREPQSVLVTSGTGSGKTECFLFPILSDLVAQAARQATPIEGVQAIMLYPLNALIESQRERLSAWTQPFDGRLRYCLFNGDLQRSAKESERRRTPEQVIDRERLRLSPPPLLVTNVTMLEYMLVRAEDRPIIDASKGKLRWIVLDEAHSLVGAAAAEIALLLRRVMLAFSVRPEEVRFVATSATIGSGESVRRGLQRFLADVAGIPDASVHVVEGMRQLPGRPSGSAVADPGDIREADPAHLYEQFGADPRTWRLVERLFEGGVPLSAFAEAAAAYGANAAELVAAMSRAARTTESSEERLAPVRVHAFERAVPGVWSCANPECSGKPAEWPFGGILSERADACPDCGAPVLEIVSCSECGEAFLEALETGGQLSAPVRNPPRDEFAFDRAREDGATTDDSEDSDGDEEDGEDGGWLRLLAANPTPAARPLWLDASAGWRIADTSGDGVVAFRVEEHLGPRSCPHCTPAGGKADLIRPLRFGAPFILGNAAPILLGGVDPARTEPGEVLPFGGRRLLSFTDSRQGTARMAAKLQIESERNFVRSFVYHQVQASLQPPPNAETEAVRLRAEIAQLHAVLRLARVPIVEVELQRRQRELVELTSGNADGIPWPEMVDRLAHRIEVADWIKGVWEARDEERFSDVSSLADFLLLREFARRPKRGNSVETLGIARLRYPSIDGLTDGDVPAALRRRGKTAEDWKSYLTALMTWFVRANSAVKINRDVHHWISPKVRLTALVGPDGQTDPDSKLRAWPNGQFRANRRSRPVSLLLHGLGLSLNDSGDRSDLDECLRAAWLQVQTAFSADPGMRVLDFRKTRIAPLVTAYFCPVTRRLLDTAPFGLSPYGLDSAVEARRSAAPITMPRHPAPMFGRDLTEARAATGRWIATDTAIADLRARGAWRDISDRVALFSDYARSAEHSAQQDSARLRRYEREFKLGRINILNCSTTMEMGIDIGSVSSVMMTNVPPSIANYRQRVGRAGRRGQAMGLAFTFCKDRPLDREAFRDPQAFLRRTLAAPKVTLESRPIVQRHVNAFLLGCFMREQSGDALKMQIGAFVGCPADPKVSRPLRDARPIETFVDWLDRPATTEAHAASLAALTQRSILEGDRSIVEETKKAAANVAETFVREWEGLMALTKDEGMPQGGRSRMAIELQRLCGEFLLGGLADRGFLPGHGFPTDVVSFLPGKEFRAAQDAPADGLRQFRNVGPQRSLDLAIRDYAPGSEIVLDGLVHRSAGVTLNWKRPANADGIAEIQSLRHRWQCTDCRASGTTRGSGPEHCPECGSARPPTQEFLRPAGFSVDPRVVANADTDALSYVPPEDPAVSTRTAAWQNLPWPELGRFRSSREGSVYYSNRGGRGAFGYAVCLQCGRAEADIDTKGLLSPEPALVDHKPLQFRAGIDRCPGNDSPFSIKRNVVLGLDVTTDTLELQPRHPLRRAAANALVIALREGLAQELGVESDEMGFAVGERLNELGGTAVSLFLFDRATGGAGFAVSFERLMRPALRRAERILDCPTPGCRKACAACVLTADAPDGKDELDRTAALEFLRVHFALRDELGVPDQFVEGAHLSLSPLDEIDRLLRQSGPATVSIYLPASTTPAGIGDWPVARQLARWSMDGHRVQLALPAGHIEGRSGAEKLALRDFAIQHSATLMTGDVPKFANGASAIAVIEVRDNVPHVWACREPEPSVPGPAWGNPKTWVVARARTPVVQRLQPVNPDALLPPPGAQLVQLGTELNGNLLNFGAAAAKTMVQLLQKCGNWPKGGIARATYRDPYVSSPLVTRLLIDTVKQILIASGTARGELFIETRPPRSNERRSQPWHIGHDWEEPADQQAVIEAYGQQRELQVSLLLKDVPHGRYLNIDFADGTAATIVLDQGFGAWAPPPTVSVRHDFSAPPTAQGRRLASVNSIIHRRGPGKTYFVAIPGGPH